ncbi:ABC transporter ATP-binding protein [Lactococcus allomyrinae]|uniref:ABC transporter ATP-binding protein n=1 Tax=Lactococcus allomyrinae TaxID=2419773 RepID=A0A387BRM7_9LACT|nr:ABC transporter ATP-binding protein [Lactococcus allomyrinae]AYG01121.1 ABC transporter ATP-binding protein [Lactococcus allomyrinae]
MAYLEVKHLTIKRKKQFILDNVSISADLGQVVGFIGQNGSGKSMLFKAICGFAIVDKGSVTVGNETIGKDVDFPSKTGMLIESPGFINSMSGYQNLYSLSLLTNNVSKQDVLELLKLVGLYEKREKKVSKYSLGMKQRLGIAQALMGNPNLIILDEPFNGLDNQGIELLLDIIENLKRINKLVLLTSHRNEDLKRVCDRYYYVEEGKFTE